MAIDIVPEFANAGAPMPACFGRCGGPWGTPRRSNRQTSLCVRDLGDPLQRGVDVVLRRCVPLAAAQ